MGIITLIVFWVAVAKVWIADGPKIPIIFILLWAIGFFAIPYFKVCGYVFMSLQAIMAVVLLLFGQYKS